MNEKQRKLAIAEINRLKELKWKLKEDPSLSQDAQVYCDGQIEGIKWAMRNL